MSGELTADCARCVGLCCVAPAFARSTDFAIDKPAGRACPNLHHDNTCGIHPTLRERGFAGCTVFDCFGAGQQVTQVTFGGRDWRTDAQTARAMFDSFAVMRQLHELLWHLVAAQALALPGLTADLDAAVARTRAVSQGDPDRLAAFDLEAHHTDVNALLLRASELARAPHQGPDHRGADLTGVDLRRADLRGASLRGARLIAADLRRVDLRGADLTGADTRGADLRQADLRGALFLTQAQVDAARGDSATRLGDELRTPMHWT